MGLFMMVNHVIKKEEFSFAANIPNIQKKNPGHTITAYGPFHDGK